MTSSHHGLYVQGYTRATMDGTNRRKPARGSKSEKTVLSSDRRLQPACVKLESLVMPYQNDGVNTFPGPYTPPVTSRKWVVLEVFRLTRKGGRGPRYDS